MNWPSNPRQTSTSVLSVSLLAPVRFALLRIRAHAQRTLVVAAGIAVAAAVLAMTAVGSVAVQDRAAQQALGALQPSDRSVQAVWSGVPGQSDLSLPQLDRLARSALEPVLGRQPFAVAVFRQATWGGVFVNLGAVDGLARWVVLRSGHAPGAVHAVPLRARADRRRARRSRSCRSCTSWGGGRSGRARHSAPTSPRPASRRPPILLANGVRGFARTPLPDADTIARTYGWVVPVAPGALHAWELPGVRRAARPRASRHSSRRPTSSACRRPPTRSRRHGRPGASPASGC